MKALDLIPKVNIEDFDERTTSGGVITIITIVFFIVAIFYEARNLNKIEYKQQASIKSIQKTAMSIYFDITVAYPCQLLNISLKDMNSKDRVKYSKSIKRQRLGPDFMPFSSKIDDTEQSSWFSQCYSCLGAQQMCCQSIFDLIDALKRDNKQNIDIYQHPLYERDQNSIEDKESCRIRGELITESQSGEIHITAGGNIKTPAHFEYDLSFYENSLSLTHLIHELRFGPQHDSVTNTLDGSKWDQPLNGIYNVDYFLNLIHTIIEDNITTQYSAYLSDKRYYIEYEGKKSNKRPEIVFHYQEQPFIIQVEKKEYSFFRYMTTICSIIGGFYTIADLIDSCLSATSKKYD